MSDAQGLLFDIGEYADARPDAPGPAPETRPRPCVHLVVLPETALLFSEPDLYEWHILADAERPRTRGDCMTRTEPCAYVACRHHLWSDNAKRMGWFEHLIESEDPEAWGETCSLRVAEIVVVTHTKDGKWVGRTGDGEPLPLPGPVLGGSPGNRIWEQVPARLASSKDADAAVIGRLLGGLSRETIRKCIRGAAAQVRSDPTIREIAVDLGPDPDALFSID